MTKQTINVGQVGNDGAGDKLRNAFVKVNENFTELYDSVSSLGSVDAAGVANLNSRINTAYTVANAAFDAANTGGGSFNNSAAYLVLTDTPFASDFGEEVYFQKANYANGVSDVIDTDVAIARDSQGGIYNPLVEADYDSSNGGPGNTEWNADGWTDLTDVKRRTYESWNNAVNGWPTGFLGRELVMHDTANDKYYAIKFLTWQYGSNQGGAGGGGFSYTRKLINTDNFFKKLGTDANTYYDTIDTGVALARPTTGGGALYNPLAGQTQYQSGHDDEYPANTRWNADGWSNLTNLEDRQWLSFVAASGKYAMDFIRDKEFIMHDTLNDNYYAIKFTDWGQNNGGSFAYHRRLIDTTKLNYGIKFPNGYELSSESIPDIGHFRFDNSNIQTKSGELWIADNLQQEFVAISNNRARIVWAENIDLINKDWNGQNNQTYVDDEGIYLSVYANLNNNWTESNWLFERTGNFIPPYLQSNARTGAGNFLRLPGAGNQKIIGTGNGDVNNWTVTRLVVAGGDSYYDGSVYHGEGGDIYLWAGRGENGGDIKVDAGQSFNAGNEGGTIKVRGGRGSYGGFVQVLAGQGDDTNGGYIDITAGQGNTTGGYISITGGYGVNDKGGDVSIDAGGSALGTTFCGNVIITTGNSQWRFSPNNIITLPADSDIKNSDGISVIKSIPQNQQSSMSNYTLVLSDAGKHILKDDGEGYGVEVPTNTSVAYEIGTTITIVSGDQNVTITPVDGQTTEIWGAGYNQTSTGWYIPNNSMATLLKIGVDKWMLSGAGLAIV